MCNNEIVEQNSYNNTRQKKKVTGEGLSLGASYSTCTQATSPCDAVRGGNAREMRPSEGMM